MSCRCYANKQKEQTCGNLNNGFLYGCSSVKCNNGMGCPADTDPYKTLNFKNSEHKTPVLWLVVIVLVIIGTIVSISEA